MPATPDRAFPPAAPTPTFPYQVEEAVGEGAMGIVYRGHDPVLDRTVAIKTMRPELIARDRASGADDPGARFVQEARAAAAISHPAITTVYGAGVEAGTPYIAMEWLTGETLDDRVSRLGPQPEATIVAYGRVLCDALAAAHDAGIVHRDIKPGNIMILSDGKLKITDFGIARIQHPDAVRTQLGVVVGTPAFAAPEQLSGEPVDGRADLYALTVVLFELATGRLPFESAALMTLIYDVVYTTAPLARTLRAEVSPALERFLARGLAKDPNARFASAREMAAELVATGAEGARDTVAASAHDTVAASAVGAPPARVSAPPQTVRSGTDAEMLTAVSAEVARRGRHQIRAALQGWEARPLPAQPVGELVERLLDRPLHAPAFSGAVELGEATLLLHDGLVYSAFAGDDAAGDEVLERLDGSVAATLRPRPADLDPAVIPALASLLLPPRVRLADLDATVTNLPRLAAKLAAETFDGALRLRVGGDDGLVLFHRGAVIFELFDDALPPGPWVEWVEAAHANADVEELQIALPLLSYRRALRDAELELVPTAPQPRGTGRGERSQAFEMKAVGGDRRGSEIWRQLLGGDPACRMLRWLLDEAAPYFDERGRGPAWKYLTSWVPLARRAWLYHALPRPKAVESDLFDAVTVTEDGKVLHVIRRIARGTPETLDAFVADVIAAKTARKKRGDIGAALLVAPRFTDEAIERYRGLTSRAEARTWVFGLQNSLAHYEGFIRLGAKRGFHLLLLEEGPRGELLPLLP